MVRFVDSSGRRPLLGQFAWFLCWVVVTAIGIILSPSPNQHGTHQQLGLPPCPMVLLFHHPCPGCGLTTSFTATVHFQFVHAFEAHPFGPVLYLLQTGTALACGYGFFFRKKFDTDTKGWDRFLGVLVMAFVAFGLIRFFLVDMYPESEFQRRILPNYFGF